MPGQTHFKSITTRPTRRILNLLERLGGDGRRRLTTEVISGYEEHEGRPFLDYLAELAASVEPAPESTTDEHPD